MGGVFNLDCPPAWLRHLSRTTRARLAVFLASTDADYVTGSTYTMDGGLSRSLGQGAQLFSR